MGEMKRYRIVFVRIHLHDTALWSNKLGSMGFGAASQPILQR
jgi:hypothetical protein